MDLVKPSLPHGTRLDRRSWHTRALVPLLAWTAATLVLVGLHRFVPRANWLMVHFVTLGIASNAIVVWSNHFADAVLRSRREDHRREVAELFLLNTGLVLLAAGVVGQWAPPVWLGAGLVAAMAGVALASLTRQARRALAARFGQTVAWYQAAAACLAGGTVLGALMAVPFGRWADALLASHLALNVLGWVGLTIFGTLSSLWPTMLRTRAVEGTETAAARALPLMVLGLTMVTVSPLLHPVAPLWWRIVGAVGVLSYLAGVMEQFGPIVRAWRHKPATSFPILSAGAGQVWFAGWLAWLVWHWMSSPTPAALVAGIRPTVVVLVVGFLLQVVLGALAYLLPVVLGGGPAMVRATTAVLERGAVARWGVTNLCLALFLLPITSAWKVTTSSAVLLALACFPVLVLQALGRRRAATGIGVADPDPHRLRRGLAIALAWTVLAAALAAAVDPVAFRTQFRGPSGPAPVSATGDATRVTVTARQMRFEPAVVRVPAGNRLVVTLVNADQGMVHDLLLANGATSGRLAPGQRTTLDVGVVTSSLEGWCSVAGHRQMGMVLRVEVDGASAPPATGVHGEHQGHQDAQGAAPTLDPSAHFPDSWRARDAALPPAPAGRLHRHTLRVTDEVVEVAPGIRQTLWTFNGTAPGPVLRGRVGDVFEITLVNDASIGHGIDFHAGALAPDRPMRTIEPGQRLVYRFTAQRAGIWMYHCSTMPMSLHIANGMYGAVVIDPPDLPAVDREYLLVQAEQYYGGADPSGRPGIADADKLAAGQPDAVVFNGHPGQYDHAPLQARVGERVRFWVLDAGPNRSWAFHIVGAQFDSVWFEGAWRLRNGATPGADGGRGGSQTLGLLASQGGFVETTFPEPGHYALVNHQMIDAERGAHGVVRVR